MYWFSSSNKWDTIFVVLFNTGLHAQRKFFSEMSADDLEAVFQKFRTDFMLFSYNLNFYDNK